MAKATFTNAQLCVAWTAQAKAGGTRGDVVKDLMVQMGVASDDEAAYRKVYNNVTQRVKQLTSHATKPLTFQTLTAGQKGARRTDADMDALQALLDADNE